MRGMLTGKAVRRQTWIAGSRSLLLGLLFRTLYGPGASIYERFTRIVFVGEWRRWQSTALDDLSPDSVVVELGCGTGAFASSVSGQFTTWIGLDISHKMIKRAKHQQRQTALFFLRADAAGLPLKDGVADAVLATFPSRYVYDNNVLSEIGRVLKPAGRFIVVLSGDLYAAGFRRRFTRAVTHVLQGNQGAAEDVTGLPGFLGMTGHFEWRATEFGRALVFTGRPSPTPDGGCNPLPDDVGGRATARPPVPKDRL